MGQSVHRFYKIYREYGLYTLVRVRFTVYLYNICISIRVLVFKTRYPQHEAQVRYTTFQGGYIMHE